ncbi:MAG: ABC-type amino acid transport substrate-binding protein [Flavobacteriales bacterium]|jgi:ABC-type amino acid transport substrate-binding protein
MELNPEFKNDNINVFTTTTLKNSAMLKVFAVLISHGSLMFLSSTHVPRIFPLFLALALLPYSHTSFSRSEPSLLETDSAVILSLAGWSPAMRAYHHDVLEAMLESTREEFGGYQIEVFDRHVSVNRVRKEIADGQRAHLDFSGMTLTDAYIRANTEHFRIPMYQGILGLRKLIIRNDDQQTFSDLRSNESFLKLTAGQGTNWQDVAIYRASGVEVVESPVYENLFPMLDAKRFDYLPLSIVEVSDALKSEADVSYNLAIHETVFIYYPIPFFLNISKNKPELVKRLQQGVVNLKKLKTFRKIFHEHFGASIETLNPGNAKVFVMNNPSVSASVSQEMFKAVNSRYFNKNTKLYYLKEN